MDLSVQRFLDRPIVVPHPERGVFVSLVTFLGGAGV